MREKFPHFRQSESKDCGPTCLKIVAASHGRDIALGTLREWSETTREGSNLLHLAACAEKAGFGTTALSVPLAQLGSVPLPCILHWQQNHYVVLYKVAKPLWGGHVKYYISDPAFGLIAYTHGEMAKHWAGADGTGILLVLEPTEAFYQPLNHAGDGPSGGSGAPGLLSFFGHYMKHHRVLLWQLCIGLLLGSLLQLVFPFLTQAVVDVGIAQRDIGFVYMVLFAQLALFAGRTIVDVFRSWVLLHLSTRINISLISDFFAKLMSLPIAYFDVKLTGDLMQRINDHKRIERLLTTSSLSVLFSLVGLVVYGVVLAWYSMGIFMVFVAGSAAYLLWILYFFQRRRLLDYKRFAETGREQSKVIELINGMQEIKLHNAERQKRWGWQDAQVRLYMVSVQGLALEQYQSVGSSVINELKNIVISIMAASLVIAGDMTLGMMMATTYMVGQLNAPIMQLIGFMRELQDARMAVERLWEVKSLPSEATGSSAAARHIAHPMGIELNGVTFRYPGGDTPVLEGISLHIPAGSTTAIVGMSGSGKTTLVKLLLGFYKPQSGSIEVGGVAFEEIAPHHWRSMCGTVMQEGYIFNDTIAGNIAVGDDSVDKQQLAHAAEIANIKEHIDQLPQGFGTLIGQEGAGLSTGQKQRLLIARAVYRNPHYLFFDEATSALDANNERAIMENMGRFVQGKTTVIVAHRLSTVRHADQIVVLDKGSIAEQGTHEALVARKGMYYTLIKNQLELGT